MLMLHKQGTSKRFTPAILSVMLLYSCATALLQFLFEVFVLLKEDADA